LKKLLHRIYSENTKFHERKNIGIILITLGVFLLCIPNPVSIKISITMTLIGFFIIFLKTGEKTTNRYTDSLMMSIIITWTIIVFFITTITDISFDAIFILITIGLLIINEFISESLPILLRNRLHFSIYIFFLIFLVLILNKILIIARI
jgi:hypothetical protein